MQPVLKYHGKQIFCISCDVFKDYSTLGVRYQDLQALVYKQGTRNLPLHEA